MILVYAKKVCLGNNLKAVFVIVVMSSWCIFLGEF